MWDAFYPSLLESVRCRPNNIGILRFKEVYLISRTARCPSRHASIRIRDTD